MRNDHHNVLDLGIPYEQKIARRLFQSYYFTKDCPEEIRIILKECDCQCTKTAGMSSIWTFVRWGPTQANEYVGIAFGHDGKLKLLLGFDHTKSRYTPKAVSAICKRIILIILALQKRGVILENANDTI